jgi:hypothetical protein
LAGSPESQGRHSGALSAPPRETRRHPPTGQPLSAGADPPSGLPGPAAGALAARLACVWREGLRPSACPVRALPWGFPASHFLGGPDLTLSASRAVTGAISWNSRTKLAIGAAKRLAGSEALQGSSFRRGSRVTRHRPSADPRRGAVPPLARLFLGLAASCLPFAVSPRLLECRAQGEAPGARPPARNQLPLPAPALGQGKLAAGFPPRARGRWRAAQGRGGWRLVF